MLPPRCLCNEVACSPGITVPSQHLAELSWCWWVPLNPEAGPRHGGAGCSVLSCQALKSNPNAAAIQQLASIQRAHHTPEHAAKSRRAPPYPEDETGPPTSPRPQPRDPFEGLCPQPANLCSRAPRALRRSSRQHRPNAASASASSKPPNLQSDCRHLPRGTTTAYPPLGGTLCPL